MREFSVNRAKLAEMAVSIHAQNLEMGWWDKWLDNKSDRHETAMMLVISELGEAMEGDRKDLMDDHLPDYPMFSVELADALIRLLDLAGAYEINFEAVDVELLSYEMHAYLRQLTKPEGLYYVCKQIARCNGKSAEVWFGIAGVMALAMTHDIDIIPISEEKIAYNAVRADHKKELRAQKGGKAY
ncbi:MAG: hypothetical protein AAFX78_02625 [Cyanobacteria bacterium J06638_20]